MAMTLNDREVELLITALDEYLDSCEPSDELEDLLSKLKGETPEKAELKFGVGHIEDYGNYVFIHSSKGDDYRLGEREYALMLKGFQQAGLGRLPEGMEGCYNLDEVFNMDIVRDRLKEVEGFVYDPQLEQDF
jgi:hypothetical protein